MGPPNFSKKMTTEYRGMLKKYVRGQLNSEIDDKLTNERFVQVCMEEDGSEFIAQSIANEFCKGKKIQNIVEIMIRKLNKTIVDDDADDVDVDVDVDDEVREGRLKSSFNESESIRSDDLALLEDWGPLMLKTQIDNNNLGKFFEEISKSKAPHVRLAGFEALYKNDLSNNYNNEAFGILLTLLKDGIDDDNKSIFEASLKLYCKLLQTPRSHDVYSSLLSAFETQYNNSDYSNNSLEKLPNFNTGINFKIFLHEKLLRILYTIIKHQKETLKFSRNADRTMEEMIDQFIIFLMIDQENTDQTERPYHKQYLSTFNLVSLIEPHASWCSKWLYSVPTRQAFITSLSKSPSLLKTIFAVIQEGKDKAVSSSTREYLPVYTINDDIIQPTYNQSCVFISGDTVNLMTYLHCLNILGQLNSYIAERNLPFQPVDLLSEMNDWLNMLALSTTTCKSLYSYSHRAFQHVLNHPTLQFNLHIGQAILHLFRAQLTINNKMSSIYLWPHTIESIDFMLHSKDGLTFLTSRHEILSSPTITMNPISIILHSLSSLLLQPITVMDVDYVVQVLQLITNIFQTLDNFNDDIHDAIQLQLYPAVDYFFHKIDQYYIKHQNNTAKLDSAIRNLLVKVVTWPLGLKALSKYPITFEELIRGSMNPFKNSSNSNEIVSLLSTVTHFDIGVRVMRDLLPHTISTTLAQINQGYEESDASVQRSDDNKSKIRKFLHVLSLFSLNTKCLAIFMMEECFDEDDTDWPKSLNQLFNHLTIIDSQFHYLSLLSLDALIWNLDILIHFLNSFELQEKLFELQKQCRIKLTKYQDNSEDSSTHSAKFMSTENNDEDDDAYMIDQASLLRHEILSKSYFIRHKLKSLTYDNGNPEKCLLFDSFPPPVLEDESCLRALNDSWSELDELLESSKHSPGLRDSGWVLQIQKAYRNSSISLKHSTFVNLLNQMERATAAVEWVDMFKWNDDQSHRNGNDEWLPEENIGAQFVLRFAEDHDQSKENKWQTAHNLLKTFDEIHEFIKYERKEYFEMFDWFLGSVFIICGGHPERCKALVKNLVRFPSAIYMWRVHGASFDAIRENEQNSVFALCQQINSIVMQELPIIDHALMNEFGLKWWMICNQFLSQCFWGILEWPEIINFLTICILHSPDYIVYFCVSLLQHSESAMFRDILNNRYWPENIDLTTYRCHEYINYMDQLAKKYQNQILHSLNQSSSVVPLVELH